MRASGKEVEMELSRRRFLTMSSGLLAGAFLSACVSMGESDPDPKDVEVSSDEVPLPGNPPLHKQAERFFLIHNEEGLLAFSARCTHQGCNVGWEANRDQFHCPCHGSTFNRRGEQLGGPAPRPLDLFAVRIQPDGGIVVTTGPTTQRKEWTPDQSVPLT
jgi:cytochrome b6-f complex iron-sulfur subunit